MSEQRTKSTEARVSASSGAAVDVDVSFGKRRIGLQNKASSTKSTMSLGVSSERRKGTSTRRRRGLGKARSELSRQFETLNRVVSEEESGGGQGKAKVLERAIKGIETLMNRATYLAVELAVASPEATQNWVRACAQGGHRPLLQTVATVMKLFAVRFDWRYAEWWTLDEADVNVSVDNAIYSSSLSKSVEELSDLLRVDGKEENAGMTDSGNVHGCAVRDSASIMHLAWTVVHREKKSNVDGGTDTDDVDDKGILEFARKSRSFKFGPRVGMPGRVWTSRRAEWLVDLDDRDVFLRSPLAEKFGMRSCLAVPIQFGGHVHSVMAFYSKQQKPYDPDGYDLACVLAQSLSEVYAPSRNALWNPVSDSIFSPQSA